MSFLPELTSWLAANFSTWQFLGAVLDYGIKILAIGFVPEGRRPSSSSAWLLAILLIPVIGLPLYLLMGSAYINRRRHRVQQQAYAQISGAQHNLPDIPDGWPATAEVASIVHLNRRLTGFPATLASCQGVYSDYAASLARIAAAIDSAERYVHIGVYIVSWDEETAPVFAAMERAAARGVDVRVLLDQVGSWKYPGYRQLGRRLDAIGVKWHLMLPLQPWKWRFRRPDLRNHRKLITIDGTTGFIGSQNLIAAHYHSKAGIRSGRRWADVMVELSGPVVASIDTVFATDWYLEAGEQLQAPSQAAALPVPAGAQDLVQLLPSGPGFEAEPNLRLFNSLVHHAKERLVLCSPYFVPDESLLEAVTTACYRGVQVELLVNEDSDQFVVGHAQSSYYAALLEAGVQIYLYPAPAILHSKFLLSDPGTPAALAVVGSSNMDMRSFGLNYECSLFTAGGPLVAELAALGETYIARSQRLTADQWGQRSLGRRYVDNAMRLTSALQ